MMKYDKKQKYQIYLWVILYKKTKTFQQVT